MMGMHLERMGIVFGVVVVVVEYWVLFEKLHL